MHIPSSAANTKYLYHMTVASSSNALDLKIIHLETKASKRKSRRPKRRGKESARSRQTQLYPTSGLTVNESVNYEGDCRTAPATSGLLKKVLTFKYILLCTVHLIFYNV